MRARKIAAFGFVVGARRGLCRVVGFGLLTALLSACGNDNILTCDTGPCASDAPTDAPDALSCGPADASSFSPDAGGAMKPPKPAHANVCTSTQITDYANCQGQQDPNSCNSFQSDIGPPGVANTACGQCIESQASDPSWGVIIFDNTMMSSNVNIGGCVDDAIGQSVVDGGPVTCGQLLYQSYGCQNAVCSGCAADDFNACDILAVEGICAPYDALVEHGGPCSQLTGDEIGGDVTNCFPNPTCCNSASPTPEQVEADWLTRIITFMCGP
jgi:hypothetical protein